MLFIIIFDGIVLLLFIIALCGYHTKNDLIYKSINILLSVTLTSNLLFFFYFKRLIHIEKKMLEYTINDLHDTVIFKDRKKSSKIIFKIFGAILLVVVIFCAMILYKFNYDMISFFSWQLFMIFIAAVVEHIFSEYIINDYVL